MPASTVATGNSTDDASAAQSCIRFLRRFKAILFCRTLETETFFFVFLKGLETETWGWVSASVE